MNPNTVSLGQGSVFSVLLRLGAPAMVSMFFQNLYALVDTVFVSWLGTIQLAAMSLCVPVFFLAMAVAKGVAVGATALMSHARGAGRREEARETATCALPLLLLLLLPFFILLSPSFNHWLFEWFDVDKTVLIQVDAYMFWLVWTFPAMGFAMICEGIHMSFGNSRIPMTANIIGNLVNIALDPALIFGCNMGIAGASLSSLIGWGLSGLIMWAALKQRDMDRPVLLCGRRALGHAKSIAATGGPVTLGMVIIPFSIMGLNYVLAPFGPAYVGAWNLSARLEQMIVLPLYGLSCALIPFAGFNLGAGDVGRIRQGVRIALVGSYGVLAPSALVLWITAPALIGLFRPEPEVLKLCVHAFRVSLLGYWLAPFELVMNGVAQGIRQTHFTLVMNLVRLIVLRLPMAFGFGALWGGEGAFVSHAASLMVSSLICLFILRYLMGRLDWIHGGQAEQKVAGNFPAVGLGSADVADGRHDPSGRRGRGA